MLKFEAQFWSKSQTLENQFELLSGRFVDPELPFKIWPRVQAKKKKPQKNDNNAKPKRFLLQKEAFGLKKEENFNSLFALGLLAFLWQKASKHNSAKNTIK